MTASQFECKGITGHLWKRQRGLLAVAGKPELVVVLLQCMQCGNSRRLRLQQKTGGAAGNAYTYQPGYLSKGERVTRAELRREWLSTQKITGTTTLKSGGKVKKRRVA